MTRFLLSTGHSVCTELNEKRTSGRSPARCVRSVMHESADDNSILTFQLGPDNWSYAVVIQYYYT